MCSKSLVAALSLFSGSRCDQIFFSFLFFNFYIKPQMRMHGFTRLYLNIQTESIL